ncbi:phosphonate C-P lyase system protein PhnG [Pelagibacterium limicola]|uniref:phosphonate C-P lyase system protein PhnG n=1 Tax=Pelagibacterium limicola TaxID=2791022 RepID=UPI0018B00801|nr:phosphonate C-P lyase system protein PhnG [Pelagibacterium limicola]
MSHASKHEHPNPARARWMGIFARASAADLQKALDGLDAVPAYEFLRRPETGLVMVRGRSGGTGNPFNFGEMSVTRCAIRLAEGVTGHSYAAGRDMKKAELAAVFDALMQTDRRMTLETGVVAALARKQAEARALKSRKAAATKVEFFTMVRGDNPL